MKKLILITSMFFVGLAIGCDSDFNCPMGQSCYKPNPWAQGLCSGQLQPQQQFPMPITPEPLQERSCSTNFQCGFGHSCVKWGNNYMGICR